MRRKSQEDLAARIRLGQRPKQRQSAARRKGRTTSELLSDEVYDRASNVLPDPRVFRKAFSGEELSTDDKVNLGVEGAFAGLAALPLIGPAAQGGKPMIKSLVKKLIGSRSKFGASDKKKLDALNKQQVKGKPPTKTAQKQQKKTEAQKLQDLKNKQNKTPVKKPDPKKTEAEKLANLNKRQKKGKPPTKTAQKQQKKTEAQRLQALASKQATGKRKAPSTPRKPMSTRAKIGTGVGAGAGAGALGTYALMSEKKAKPAQGSQSGSSGQSVNPSPGGAQDELNIGGGGFGSGKTSKQPDDGYRFYGKKGTGLGDTSRKYGIQYATQKQFDKDFDDSDGEKAGGRPGRGKMKSQGMNRSKRSGFSGRGSGAALRGF